MAIGIPEIKLYTCLGNDVIDAIETDTPGIWDANLRAVECQYENILRARYASPIDWPTDIVKAICRLAIPDPALKHGVPAADPALKQRILDGAAESLQYLKDLGKGDGQLDQSLDATPDKDERGARILPFRRLRRW